MAESEEPMAKITCSLCGLWIAELSGRVITDSGINYLCDSCYARIQQNTRPASGVKYDMPDFLQELFGKWK